VRVPLGGLVFLLLVGCNSNSGGPAAGPVDTSTVRPQAEAIAKAVLDRDHATLVDYTHPRVVEGMGGRERMIERVRGMEKEMDAAGFRMVGHEVGDVGEPVVDGGTAYVVVKTTLRLAGPGTRGVSESYLLGVSDDGGKTWKFADGAGLSNPEHRARAFPNLPAGLRLPEKKPPVFTDVPG
jgi:hypothetical protein